MGAGAACQAGASRAASYQGRTTFAVVLIALVASSGGLLLGFDIGVTGGVISHPDFASKFFPLQHDAEGSGDGFCRFNDHVLQLFTSCLFLAGAAAAIAGASMSKRWGRKFTLMAGGAAFLGGTALVALANATVQLVIGRLVLGVGVGFSTQATPLYLSEMAPHNLRGALNIAFQLAVTVGILCAQLINFATLHMRDGWRVSLGLGAVPALMLLVGSICLPDTPASLVERGRVDQGRQVLVRVRGTPEVDAEFADITDAVRLSTACVSSPWRTILRRRYWPQLVICVLMPAFQQLTGINAIMFYAPQLFQAVSNSTSAALLSTVVTGSVNLVATLVAILTVDRLGRRFLLVQGGAQMLICEVVVACLIKHNFDAPGNPHLAAAILAFVCIYVAAFAWSWGPIGWLIPSEVQPLETRAAGTGLATTVNFIFTFLVGQVFLSLLCMLRWAIFLFFGGFVLLATAFVVACVPETKGIPIEELDEVFAAHPVWSRVVAGAPRGDEADAEADVEICAAAK